MIVYNTTFHIENEILIHSLDYLKKVYIPHALSSGFLQQPVLRRVLQNEKEEGHSYALQFHVKNIDTLEYWLQKEGRQLQKELINRFGNKLIGFTTLLEEIDWEQ